MINRLTDHKIKVTGFDADDTLWENEDLFYEVQNEIKEIVMKSSNNFDKELLKTEKSNLIFMVTESRVLYFLLLRRMQKILMKC